MTTVIRLTSEQAEHVAGESPTDPEVFLTPVPYHLGGFILNVSVLDNPAFANHHDYLAALPQETYVPPPPEED